MTQKTRGREGHPTRETAAAARQAARRRRLLTLGIPAALIAVIAAVAVVTSLRGRGEGNPAPPGEVQVSAPALQGPLQVGQTVPDFSAPAIGGGRVAWRDVRGTPTALVVWASWCPHCQRELPVVARVAPEFPGVRVLTVTTAIGLHPGPSPEEFVRSEHLAFPVAVDDASQTLAQALGIQSFPTVYWVGAMAASVRRRRASAARTPCANRFGPWPPGRGCPRLRLRAARSRQRRRCDAYPS